MLNWLVRPIMYVAAIIAGWFVAQDSANFGVVQLVISVLLVTGLVAIATFWTNIVAWLRGWRVPK
ncbi:hypothetical protein [Hyphomicrobium sp. CS1GBMeth3]|uniref:hypothetical protein n=1 Tax=Hyphomicrobium sp. CS1GBMeth3 TaxID=1892845 RepID=UPI000931E0B7|nr:hypothetical protein [Hyphomicrobium sp. CS1GBMeth3]